MKTYTMTTQRNELTALRKLEREVRAAHRYLKGIAIYQYGVMRTANGKQLSPQNIIRAALANVTTSRKS